MGTPLAVVVMIAFRDDQQFSAGGDGECLWDETVCV